MEFCHLHCHTQFSLLDGAADINLMMKKAVADGQKAVAITDHGNMFGVFKFWSAAKKHGVKPILGCEVYVVKDHHRKSFSKEAPDKRYHQLLLAKNAKGYQNLCKICSLGFTEGFYKSFPRVTRDIIKKHSEGIIATTCCLGSEVQQAILNDGEEAGEKVFLEWLDIFGENYYIELQRHDITNIDRTGISQEDINQILIKWSKKYNVKMIATNDSHYVEEEDWDAHDALLCINSNSFKAIPIAESLKYRGKVMHRGQMVRERFGFKSGGQFYFKKTGEMSQLFGDVLEAVENTAMIAEQIEPLSLKRDILMPNYVMPPQFKTQDEYLRHLTFEGAKLRYKELTSEIVERLDHELKIIENMGFPGYFLIVQDFIQVAKKIGVAVGPGRGCLTGDAPVILANGATKALADMRVGDEVFTVDGSPQKVVNTFAYDVQEELLTIKTYYGEHKGITLTKDHKVYAETQQRPANYENWAESTKKARKMPDPTGQLSWMPAEQLKVGDWLFIPKPKVKVKDIAYFDLSQFSNEQELHHDEGYAYHDVLNVSAGIVAKRKKVKRKIKLDADWYTIFGLFVGDGWIRKNERPQVSIVFYVKETKKINWFRNKMEAHGFDVSEQYVKNTVQVHVRNKQLYLLFKKLFKDYQYTSATKHVPDFIMQASEENVAHFLRGYNWADGHEAKHKFRFTTVSRRLADQIRFLCWRIGIPASLGVDNRVGDKREEFKNRKLAYTVTVPKSERIGSTTAEKRYFYRKVKGGILVKIRSIAPTQNINKVYDIEVANHHNYLTSSFLVHNSAAGSAVAYCTGITNIDPLRYKLLFERFLNPERVSMPDIDIDFDDEGRQRVIDYVVDKYGKNQVAQIITYGTMAAKSAIRDVARVLELPLAEADKLAKLIPEGPKVNLKKAFAEVPELKGYREDTNSIYQPVLKMAETLEGSVRHRGIHAAGVIIAPDDLTNYIPICTAKDADLAVTQFDGRVIEDAGMLKMDFLGLKTLTIIKDAIENIHARFDLKRIEKDLIPEGEKRIDPELITGNKLDDKKTYQLFQRGETVGIFQFESTGMQKYLKQLKPTNIEDLIAMNALYRPGPMDYIPTFVDRKHGRETVEYPHEWLEPILKDTYGIMVYQEQIMQTAQIMADFSLGQADLLRRAMGKKKLEAMAKMKIVFREGAGKKGVSEEKADEIFGIMEKFASYGFNRSHSAAYSMVAFQTAYLKAHYGAEYMASVLTHNMNDITKVNFFLSECQRMGIKALVPDVNESRKKFTVNQKGEIRFALAAIKGVGDAAVEALIKERTQNGAFKDIFDVVKRISLRTVNKRCFEALAQAGAFDSFVEPHRAQYFEKDKNDHTFIEVIVKFGNQYQNGAATAETSLFGMALMDEVQDPTPPECEEWTLIERLNKEKEVTGIYLSGHPLDDYKLELNNFCTCTLDKLPKMLDKSVKVGCIVVEAIHRVGKTGKPFGKFILEDYSGTYELMLFGESYIECKNHLEVGHALYIEGTYQPRWRGADYSLKPKKIKLLSSILEELVTKITLKMNLEQVNNRMIMRLEKLQKEHQGELPVGITVLDRKNNYDLKMSSGTLKLARTKALFSALEGLEDVEYVLN